MERNKTFQLRAGDVQRYRVCEDLSEGLIYAMVIFSPWAFGTTQKWSIWTMNAAGYALGVLLLVKLSVRWLKGYQPPRWEMVRPSSQARLFTARNLVTALSILTVAILLYCFISAVNAYATYHRYELSFDYHDCIKWLPHTFDSNLTWPLCWSYLALACSFWAVRDWLLGKTTSEERAAYLKSGGTGGAGELFPARLRRLLWLLAINGGLIGLEGIVQRLEGSGKLLFFVKPRVNPDALSQFGPYAYRANAAQYFNLLWPVCVGFWWMLHRARGFKRHAHHIILICAVIMAACPIICTSRGGAIITAGILALGTVFLVATHFLFSGRPDETRRARIVTVAIVILFCASSLVIGWSLGWKALKPRMAQLEEGFEGREEMYAAARPMTADYPVFGTGPGTFETVFQLYRISTDTYWPVQLHNDWLETRITFGWAGLTLILCALAMVLLRWFARGGIHGGRRFVILLWLAIAGCLVHARFDFPFQIYSIVFLFLICCAVLSTLSRRS
jgi:hypothetical protein